MNLNFQNMPYSLSYQPQPDCTDPYGHLRISRTIPVCVGLRYPSGGVSHISQGFAFKFGIHVSAFYINVVYLQVFLGSMSNNCSLTQVFDCSIKVLFVLKLTPVCCLSPSYYSDLVFC